MRRRRNRIRIGRNEQCPCGSGSKFKRCHGGLVDAPQPMPYIDSGEEPVRWVIISETGTAFFADVGNRIIVFPSREIAHEITQLEMFAERDPGEINIAGIGPTKWAHLQESFPFVEVQSAAQAQELIAERLQARQTELGITPAPALEEEALPDNSSTTQS